MPGPVGQRFGPGAERGFELHGLLSRKSLSRAKLIRRLERKRREADGGTVARDIAVNRDSSPDKGNGWRRLAAESERKTSQRQSAAASWHRDSRQGPTMAEQDRPNAEHGED